MISIDADAHKRAQDQGHNISAVCEQALRLKTNPKKSDVPEDQLKLECYHCKEIVEEGFLCEITNKFSCDACEKATIKSDYGYVTKYTCVHKDHEHIKIPGLDGENIKKIIKIDS